MTNILGLTAGPNEHEPGPWRQIALALDDSASSRTMVGKIRLLWNYRYPGSSFSVNQVDIWDEIKSIQDDETKLTATSLTYLFNVTVGSKKHFYIGKTVNSMGVRYKNFPPSGGLGKVFANFSGHDVMDISIYQSTNPALVEGWCFAIAKSDKSTLVNMVDAC